jgi:hypothetical protein
MYDTQSMQRRAYDDDSQSGEHAGQTAGHAHRVAFAEHMTPLMRRSVRAAATGGGPAAAGSTGVAAGVRILLC